MRPNSRFRLDREGYDRCGQLLREAGIEFIEKSRTKSHLGPNQLEETIIHGTIRSARSLASCRLWMCGHHYKLDIVKDRSDELVNEIAKALGTHLLNSY